MTAPEETPRQPPQPDTESTNKCFSEDSYKQGWLPRSPGKLGWEWGRGLGDRGSRAHQHPEDSWTHPPYGVSHHIVGTRQAMLHAPEGCICPPPALPRPSIPGASHLSEFSNRAPGPRCWEQESTWRLRLGNSQGSGDMGGYRCPAKGWVLEVLNAHGRGGRRKGGQ